MNDILEHGVDEFRDYVNAFAVQRVQLSGAPTSLVAVGDDGALIDRDGNRWHDFVSGYGTQAMGHRNPAIAGAVRAFLDSDAPSFYPTGVSPFAGRAAKLLCERTGYDNAFFASGGAEAVEAAIKLARAFTGMSRIVCLEGAYHGCTYGALAMMQPGELRDRFGPHLPDVVALPFGDVRALRAELDAGDVAAVVVEPIQVEGGVRALSSEYVEALCELAPACGALVIADEIQTGLGRAGALLASSAWPRRPDIVTLAKFLGGGLVPCSAMLAARDVHDYAYGTMATAESHNSTFSGNALACVAAIAALDLLDEPLFERVRAAGDSFAAALSEACAHLPLVTEIRGAGLLRGIALATADHPWLTFEYLGLDELAGRPAVGTLLCHRLYKRGFLTHVCGHDWSVVRIQPALNTTDDVLAAFATAAAEEIEFLCDLE